MVMLKMDWVVEEVFRKQLLIDGVVLDGLWWFLFKRMLTAPAQSFLSRDVFFSDFGSLIWFQRMVQNR